MADTTVPIQGGTGVNITVPASGIITTSGAQPYQVVQIVGFPNEPNQPLVLFAGSGIYTSSAFTNGATVMVLAGSSTVSYNVGLSPVIGVNTGSPTQGNPGTLNATGTITAALIYTRIITSTTAAAVAGTLDAGAIMETSENWAIGDSVNWSVINTGASNAFTVTASTGHTIVGTGVVALSSSGTFRTRKTAASTFVTYRLGS